MASLPIQVRRWTRISDVVAVVADLKSSTQLGTGSKAASTASIYEAGTGGVVKIFDLFAADFLQIQGDGAFALFWGELRFQRAAAAGITIKTFSLDLTEKIEKKWPSKPQTGVQGGDCQSPCLGETGRYAAQPGTARADLGGKASQLRVQGCPISGSTRTSGHGVGMGSTRKERLFSFHLLMQRRPVRHTMEGLRHPSPRNRREGGTGGAS